MLSSCFISALFVWLLLRGVHRNHTLLSRFVVAGVVVVFRGTRTWRKVEPAGAPPAARFGYVGVVHSHYFLLCFGGYDGKTWLNDMHRFDFGERGKETHPMTTRERNTPLLNNEVD